jgi:hypothetical protein
MDLLRLWSALLEDAGVFRVPPFVHDACGVEMYDHKQCSGRMHDVPYVYMMCVPDSCVHGLVMRMQLMDLGAYDIFRFRALLPDTGCVEIRPNTVRQVYNVVALMLSTPSALSDALV